MSHALIGVVEDDAAVRGSLVLLLENNGFRVQSFDSAEMFLAEAQLADLEGLIFDIRLPGMSGLELADHLADRKLPTLVITGHEDSSSVINLISEGNVEFLAKPFDPLTFLEVLTKAMAK